MICISEDVLVASEMNAMAWYDLWNSVWKFILIQAPTNGTDCITDFLYQNEIFSKFVLGIAIQSK